MCGSGRLLRGFAKAGFETIGVDNSPEMLALAQEHYARDGLQGEWLCANVETFDLDAACALAVCPINSLAHLSSETAMLQHLHSMTRNLYVGSSYWIQLDLKQSGQPGQSESWEFELDGETVRFDWQCDDASADVEMHRSRFTFPDGRMLEESHQMKVWSFDTWTALLARSRFDLAGVYTNNTFEPLPISRDLNGEHVFWQQLIKAL